MIKNRIKIGALPDSELRKLRGAVDSVSTHVQPEVGPASIDVPCGDEFYRLPGVVLPVHGELVSDLIHRVGVSHSLSSPLEVGHTYAVPLGGVRLPHGIYGYYNPKSSLGRVDVHCRVIADKVSRYDTCRPERLSGGYDGRTWLLVTPNSFTIMPPANLPLVQLRLFNGDTRFKKDSDLRQEWRKNPLAYHGKDLSRAYALDDFKMSDSDGTILFTADLEGDDGVIGYRARPTREVLDLRRVYAYDGEDFFDPVRAKNGEVLLAPEVFYLLRTDQAVMVPAHLAAELIAMDERIFEGRSHYAGFVDPGFFDRITLEIRCRGMLLREGQPIARIQFERLISKAMVHYGKRDSHYHKGNTLLSKHFKLPV